MPDDIVKRLRAPAYWVSGSEEGHEGDNDAPREAADEIERLRAEVERLTQEREALLKDRENYTGAFLRAEVAQREIERLTRDRDEAFEEAAKAMEAWPTFDVWRSEAAAAIRALAKEPPK